jgi:23S rRNA (cytosine1962-C5)-methyltransferase
MGYELLDAGEGRRLERFGARVVDRPAPAATGPRRGSDREWLGADLRFDRDSGWIGPTDRSPWTIAIDRLVLELRPTDSGQVGLYPEHATLWPWLARAIAGVIATGSTPSVLHLFASTGATTLAMVRCGARVTHVDASRSALAWARRNAELSGLAGRPVRWIVDDALEFSRREARRGSRYHGFVLDPPTYGHGPGGSPWHLRDALPQLLSAGHALAAEDAFILLTSHTTGMEAGDLADTLADAFGDRSRIDVEPIELVATSGATLPLGAAARMIRA